MARTVNFAKNRYDFGRFARETWQANRGKRNKYRSASDRRPKRMCASALSRIVNHLPAEADAL
jgi:hypothetical protein